MSIDLIFRAWHSSLNEFVVRYLYIPLGGRKYQWATVHFININEIICLQVWLIFLYIGVWHDLMWRWISWSLLNCIFFSLENVVIVPFFFSARVGIFIFFLVHNTSLHGCAKSGIGDILKVLAELLVSTACVLPT